MNFVEALPLLYKEGKTLVSDSGVMYKIIGDKLKCKLKSADCWIVSSNNTDMMMELEFELYDDTFDNLGRNHGEFRVGDIIRYSGDDDLEEVVGVYGDCITVNYYCTNKFTISEYTYIGDRVKDLRLICPVENRLDMEVS